MRKIFPRIVSLIGLPRTFYQTYLGSAFGGIVLSFVNKVETPDEDELCREPDREWHLTDHVTNRVN